MKMAPKAALEVLLGLPPLRVMIEAQAQVGICQLMCSQPCKPKSANFGHTRKSWDMVHEPILRVETERMIPIYAYHKPFTVKFPDKCEWQKGFQPDINRGLVWYSHESKTNKSTGAGVCSWGSRRWHSFRLGLHTTVFRLKYMPLRLV
jgi:hypothetical protein